MEVVKSAVLESLRSENEDEYAFRPREVWYSCFVLASCSRNLLLQIGKKKKTVSRSLLCFFTCLQGKKSHYDGRNAVYERQTS